MADRMIKSVRFLPEFLQTGKNEKFLSSTLDQLIQKPELERLDGYIGSTRTLNYSTGDVYISEIDSIRSDYQLEPAVVFTSETDEVTDVIGINDLINEISINGAKAENFDELFRTQFYAFDPHIDSDKFINYQNYYWLTNGPSIISINDSIDIDTDVVGKESYFVPSLAIPLQNGMKIKFTGSVTPTSYKDKVYYVEGVGTSIKLVDETSLIVAEGIASSYGDSFDKSLFDEYPFDGFTKFPLTPEYITINKSSTDLNSWSRYNRWFHKDVILLSAQLNNVDASLPISLKASRPIIEFKPNIKLYNFGTLGIPPIDCIDSSVTDVFSFVEGSAGHHVDGYLLQQGNRVIFTADSDLTVKNNVYEVNFLNIDGKIRLNLVKVLEPSAGDVTFVKNGKKYGGTTWWFDGSEWIKAQQHTELNQPPLFDLFDGEGNSYSDKNYYNSDFKGNKIFGYDVGSGAPDKVLGFPLKYKNSVGVGSYLFKNYFTSETITISQSSIESVTISTAEAFLKIADLFKNVWKQTPEYPIPLVISQLNTSTSFYDLPLGLTNNPFNEGITSLTFSDYVNHANTTTQLRLISTVNPMPFAHTFIGKKEHSCIDAVTKASEHYNTFKLAFLKKISEVGLENDPVASVDLALQELNINKTERSLYYLSDMVAYGNDYVETNFTVSNSSVDSYPINDEFDPNELSLRSVLIYLNDNLLIHEQDYEFLPNDNYIKIKTTLSVGDKISIKDFKNTKGNYIPSTPTKLGLYPKFKPRIFIDDSYYTPTKVIEGHDGSIFVAYNDYRDDIILEFEKRIYNNIKANYDQSLLDLHAVWPGAFRNLTYTLDDINKIIQQDFIKWSSSNNVDVTTNSLFVEDDSYTYNYTGSYVPELDLFPNGSWRSMLYYFYDTDRPDLCPWEMLGFSEKPDWWEEEYGAAPYLSTNTKLWTDLEQGRIRQGDRAGIDEVYSRPGLSNILPVDASGVLEDPDEHVINLNLFNIRQPWKFGDFGPAEYAWRKSSYFPFVVQKVMALTKPADYAALMYDPARLRKNSADQLVYGSLGKFLDLREMPIHGENDNITSGYSVYISEIGKQRSINYIQELRSDLTKVSVNLFYRVGGFVDKTQLQISIDSFDPLSTAPGSVLQPEDYKLILNISNPIKESSVSGILVEKNDGKFLVRGLDTKYPFFKIYNSIRSSTTPTITVGGISESFVTWQPSSSNSGSQNSTVSTPTGGLFYSQGQFVKYTNKFYIVKTSHRGGVTFESQYFQEIPRLPIKGGATVQIANSFENTETVVPYGTTFETIQQVYDLIIGYGKWLEQQGFIFDQYNVELQTTLNWDFTAKEFLYWTTQNWSDKNIIALSPFADQLQIRLKDAVVDNIFNNFYEYSILEASGLPLSKEKLNVVRADGLCTISVTDAYTGIYFARLYSIQKEHAIVFNNRTIFNDSIYEIETGYRQSRMKLLGFRTAKWNGDYFSPGFIYDTAIISDWKQFTDYKFEDVVRFNGKFYAAMKNLVGSAVFNFEDWRLLGKKPVAGLIPNFDYKINQFEDFYSLDINNFDEAQQKAAQKLIGYIPRPYLNNIFADPISQYKFYQGFIKEKGTKNSVIKLQRATVQNLNGKIDYNEEWAFRLGYYGSYSSYSEIEFPLIEGSFLENPQIIEFTDNTATNLRIALSLSDFAIKPTDNDLNSIFVDTTDDYSDIFIVGPAGYARFDDVDYTALNEDALITIEQSEQIEQNETIWLANNNLNDWTILRKRLSKTRLESVTIDNLTVDQFNFVTDVPHNFSAGQLIVVEEFNEAVNGIYKINSIVDKNTFSVIIEDSTIVENITEESLGLIFVFDNSRFLNFDSIPEDSYLLSLPRNSKLWVDSNLDNKWNVYEKIKNYRTYSVRSNDSPQNQDLGFNISKQKNSDVFLVSNPSYIQPDFNYGSVFVYKTVNDSSTLLFRYGINDSASLTYYDKSQPTGFGSALFYETKEFIDNEGPTGYGIIYAGAPYASKVEIPSTSTITSTLVEQGLVKISSLRSTGVSQNTLQVLQSPTPVNNERYGFSIAVANKAENKILLVGAPFTPTIGVGKVYKYHLSTSTVNTGTLDIISTTATSLVLSTINQYSIINSGTNYQVGDVVTIVSSSFNNEPLDLRVSKVSSAGNVQSFAMPIDNRIVFNVPPGTTINSPSITTNGTGTGLVIDLISSTEIGSQWGYCISGSSDSSFERNEGITAIGAPGFSFNKGIVCLYSNTTTEFLQYLTSPFENYSNFGSSIVVSPSADYIFVSALNARGADQSYGKVAIYHRETSTQTFTLTQIISNPIPGVGMKFGQSLDINFNDTELVISAVGTNREVGITFDEFTEPLLSTSEEYDNDPNSDFSDKETSYDIDSTFFNDRITYSGVVYVYNRKESKFRLADRLMPVDISSGTNFGHCISIDDTNVFVGAPAIFNSGASYSGPSTLFTPTQLSNDTANGAFYQYYKIDKNAQSWKNLREQPALIKTNNIQKITLIDIRKDEVIDYLEVVDPLKGKILGIAEQEISYKLSYDPAVYTIGNNNVVIDTNLNWLDEYVGKIWWDLSTVKYPWYEQGELEYRKNYWGSPFPGSTIDIYEWVRTTYLPTQWASLADTKQGLELGVSGQPKYLTNDIVSAKQIYDPISGSFINYYYYWVKNSIVVPSTKNRRISAFQIARLIENPQLQGERYLEILSSNSLAVVNSSNLLVENNIHLNVVSDEINNKIPRHTEWTILDEGNIGKLPTILEKKLLDSLKGTDSLGNVVPDPTLSPREKYGISIRPRQSMFKDRIEALRNIIEYSNSILLENRITGVYSFNNLNAQDLPPDVVLNEYDQVVEDLLDLELIYTTNLETAELGCNIANGKIVSVTILNPGYGYLVPPTVIIEDNFEGAEILTEIDSQGRVIGTVVKNSGNRFSSAPVLTVRPYTVLVLSDETYNGKWTEYVFDSPKIREWSLDRGYAYGEKIQYNTNYYSAKYNISINTPFDPQDWILLSLKETEGKWVRYKTQLFNTPLYWDYVDWQDSSFDRYKDLSVTVEDPYQLNELTLSKGQYVKIRNSGNGNYIIIEKLEEDSLGTYGFGYNIVYAESGTIQISNAIWNTAASTLGFDQSTYDQTLFSQTPDIELEYILNALRDDIFIGNLKEYWNRLFFTAVRYALSEQKFLDWAFKTSFINVINRAGELKQLPVYKLANAEYYEDYLKEAKPYHTQIRSFTTNHTLFDLSNVSVTDFDLPSVYDKELGKFITVSSGSSYLSQYPWKDWADNYGSTDTTRINQITLKYDRYSREKEINSLDVVDSFIADGVRSEFVLSWLAHPDQLLIEVFVDNNKVLSNSYQIVFYKQNYNSYLKKFSKLVFTGFIPSADQRITVNYKKNTALLSAIDRTLSFYSPTAEMPGLELPLLMAGLEYPQTTLEGIALNYSTQWGDEIAGYDSAPYEDELSFYTFTTSTSVSTTYLSTLTLVEVYDISGIEAGQTVNIVSSLTPYFSSVGPSDEPRVYAVVTASNYVYINKVALSSIPQGAQLEFYSYNENPSILDTQIIGGDFSYIISTDTGAIVIDGDGFITPNTSYAPEELIPGELNESLGINVYTKAPVQVPVIISSSIDILDLYTTTTRILTVVPPGPGGVIVSCNNSVVSASIVETAQNLTSTIYLSTLTNISVGDPIYQSPGIQEQTFVTGFTGTNGLIISKPIVNELTTGTILQVIKVFVPTIFNYVEYQSSGTTFTNANQYTIDWSNDNGKHPALLISPQPVPGRIIYTAIGMGGASTNNQTGFIDSKSAVVNNVDFVEIESLSGIDTVKSAYVVVNGNSISNVESSTSTYYVLTYANELNKRAAAKVYNLSSGTNTVSAWFFGTEQKLWNEIKEEIKTVPRFTKTFTGLATLNSNVVTNVSDVSNIVPGSTTVYARNTSNGFYLQWSTGVLSVVGDTITLTNQVTSLPPDAVTTATLEFGIVINGYTEISSTGTYNSSFAYPPGNIKPEIASTIIEFYNSQSKSQRMLVPPDVDYYSVTNPLNNSFAITNKNASGAPVTLNINEIRVYLNGNELRRGFDYIFNSTPNIIKIDSSILSFGDVVAILNKPGSAGVGQPDYEYDIYNDNLLLCATPSAQQQNPISSSFFAGSAGWNTDWQGEIKIITYNNHDHLGMRTETFDGNPSGRFKLSRPILDESYVWVSINGIPLANYIDFEMLDDQMTVQITNSFALTTSDIITIRSFASNKTTADILGFRIFNDLFNRTHYKRLSKINSTELTQPLTEMDSVIYVKDANVLTKPIVDKNIPGVVLINGERIEFFTIENNVLGQLRRGTLGTSPKVYSQPGTAVIDQGTVQSIPYADKILVQNFLTTASTYNYSISTSSYVYNYNVNSISTGSWYNNGIILSGDNLNDQIEVYYGGRKLNKDYTYYQDPQLSYDSQEIRKVLGQTRLLTTSTVAGLPALTSTVGTAYVVTTTNQVWVYENSLESESVGGYVYRGLMRKDPEFTLNTSTQELILNISGGVSGGIRVTVVKKEFLISTLWNNGESLLDSNSNPAKFLRARPAELPDDDYYGGDFELTDDTGAALTDNQGSPLIGNS